jgi:hypothetical protein
VLPPCDRGSSCCKYFSKVTFTNKPEHTRNPSPQEPFVAATSEFLRTFRKAGAPPPTAVVDQAADSVKQENDTAQVAEVEVEETEAPTAPAGHKVWSIDGTRTTQLFMVPNVPRRVPNVP